MQKRCLTLAVLVFVCGLADSQAQTTRSIITERNINDQVVQSERDEQEALYNYYFRDQKLKYNTEFATMKKEATVPKWRIPYSAHTHPESSGGMTNIGAGRRGILGRRGAAPQASGSSPLLVYDRAFNGEGSSAHAFELKRLMGSERAIFPALRIRLNSESWEGYCSGFTASTIRHPEPVKAVDAGDFGGTKGVILQPSDIKALLTCIYNRTTSDSFLFLAPPSANGGPNMGSFHLTLANYIGEAGHPVGIDRTKGEVAWNNPIYSYKINSVKDAGSKGDLTYKELQTTITYAFYGADGQQRTNLQSGERVSNQKQSMKLRYRLALDKEGQIVGGQALSSSGHFLWLPLYAVQANEEMTVPGNPFIDVKKVIDIARASAIPDVQQKYDHATIGPRVDPTLLTEKR